MFDPDTGIGNVRLKKKKDPFDMVTFTKPMTQPNELDSEEMIGLHRRLMSYFITEQDRQRENRAEQAEDDNFYDNIQWDPADVEYLRSRGQEALVINVISAAVDWVTGTEKKTRTDFTVLPRRKEEAQQATRKTELLKYLSDVSRASFHKSRAFEDAIRAGLGWIEDGYDDESDGEPIYTRYEDWRNILYDSTAMEMDLSDARYIFRFKWTDMDLAKAKFPDRHGLLDMSSVNDESVFGMDELEDEVSDQKEIESRDAVSASQNRSELHGGYHRSRVRLIEAWFKIPVKTEKLKGGQFDGEIFDEYSEAHVEAVNNGESTIRIVSTLRMHVAIFTTKGMLYFGRSPYRHNQYPFTPIWGYRRSKDGLPYGMIRRLKDLQRDINKRHSKALHILSSSKVIMDHDAVDDIDEFADEVSRPDAIIVKKRGSELKIDADRDLAPAHLQIMNQSIGMVQTASGVTDELVGRTTNATSGIAIQRRQDQGSMATAKLFDNNIQAQQIRGEKLLSLAEQFISEKKAFRITNKRGKPEYIEINDGLPENDITRTKADYLIDEEAARATNRQTQLDNLTNMMRNMPPQVMIVFLDLIITMTDLPYADEIANRIRSISGMPEPDADPEEQNEPTPEEIAAMQEAQKQAQMQEAEFAANLRLKNANALKIEAQAEEIKGKSVGTNVDAQKKSLEAARLALSSPSAIQVADHILHESGFNSRSSVESAAAAGLISEQQQLEEQEQQQQIEQQLTGQIDENLTGAAENER